jgi:NTP pyrophosphatase (non-canonical NTP hydrolase)
MTINQLQEKIRLFRDERNWMQFHNHKDMAIALAIEAAELQELFLWKKNNEIEEVAVTKRERITEEIADIAVYLFELADNLGIDIPKAIDSKLMKNAHKYPVDKARGSSKKYTEL